jgi:hypothetical protein
MPGTAVAICSICSREKREDPDPLPARELYIGAHIAQVNRYAEEKGLPFYVLSGLYGIVAAEKPVSPYKHELNADEVFSLSLMIYRQLRELKLAAGIEEVHFFTLLEEEWIHYQNALKLAVDCLDMRLHVRYIHELSSEKD